MRIDDNYLRGDRVDGEVITSADFNELETIIKTAINANYDEISNLKDIPLYYYNGLHNQENLDMFNEICGLFDNRFPFVLVGRFEVELQTGEDTFEMEEVVAPIQVKNYTDRETGGTVLSFATAPIWLGSQYNIATIGLVGEWGNFTDFQTVGWSALQGPSVNVKTFEGYDETKTQVLKNINGVLTWVEE